MDLKDKNVAGVILAAGEGKRIGRNKALLEIAGVSFLKKIALSMREAGCNPVIVVGGADADAVGEEAREVGVRFVLNENWRCGQFSSVKTGLSELGPASVGAMVALVDHPLVADVTYRVLVESFLKRAGEIIVPTYRGRRGHPVLLPRDVIEEIIKSSDSLTLRDIMNKCQDMVFEQVVSDASILEDIDTEGDLKRAGQTWA